MRFYSALVSSILFASQALAQWKAGVTIAMRPGHFRTIYATFRVPSALGPNISAVTPYVAFDDGNLLCPDAVQVGVEVDVDEHGRFSCKAWYKKKSDALRYFNITISAGHLVRISWDSLPQMAYVENLSTGVSQTAYTHIDSHRRCEFSVTWGISAVPMGSTHGLSYYPIANFGNITFVNATVGDYFTTKTHHPEERGAVISNMTLPDDVTLVTTKVGKSTVTFSYVSSE